MNTNATANARVHAKSKSKVEVKSKSKSKSRSKSKAKVTSKSKSRSKSKSKSRTCRNANANSNLQQFPIVFVVVVVVGPICVLRYARMHAHFWNSPPQGIWTDEWSCKLTARIGDCINPYANANAHANANANAKVNTNANPCLRLVSSALSDLDIYSLCISATTNRRSLRLPSALDHTSCNSWATPRSRNS